MNNCRFIVSFALATLTSFLTVAQRSDKRTDKIRIAFLLDISGSMDQLLLKTKSLIWRIANYY
jgi:hypothetical protein